MRSAVGVTIGPPAIRGPMVTPNRALLIAVFTAWIEQQPSTGGRTARGVPGLLSAWHDPWRGRAAAQAQFTSCLRARTWKSAATSSTTW